MKRGILWVPLALFILFVAVVAMRLYAPSEDRVRSRMVGQPMPTFALDAALPAKPTATSVAFGQGKARVLNIFASWCVPCIAEAPQLEALAARGIPIDAIAIRDRPEDIRVFLDRYGDPFQAIGADPDSSVQMLLGSSGVPETFVIDGQGIIRHQHIGAINPNQLDEIVAAYEAAR